MPGPGRPKEHPEERLRCPEAAADAFLDRHPALQVVVGVASATPQIVEWLGYMATFALWKQRYDAILSLIEPPPPLPNATVDAANKAGGERLREITAPFQRVVAVFSEFTQARSAYGCLPSFSVPDLVEFEDRPFMMAVVATWMASELGKDLDPLDIVLLLVASQNDRTTSDEGEYEKRLDRWRKRMPRVRKWAAALSEGFQRNSTPGPLPAESGGTASGPAHSRIPPESE